MSDKKPEHAATEMFDDLKWLPPVASLELLPTDGLRPGHVCFVIGERAIFEYQADGTWRNTADSPK